MAILAFLKWQEKQEFSWVWRNSTCTLDAEHSRMDMEKTISYHYEPTLSV